MLIKCAQHLFIIYSTLKSLPINISHTKSYTIVVLEFSIYICTYIRHCCCWQYKKKIKVVWIYARDKESRVVSFIPVVHLSPGHGHSTQENLDCTCTERLNRYTSIYAIYLYIYILIYWYIVLRHIILSIYIYTQLYLYI